MTEAELLKTMAWEDFSIQSHSTYGYLLILICKDEPSARNLLLFLNKNTPTVRVSMNSKTLEYSIHFFFKNTSESLEYKTGKTIKTYPPLHWLGSGVLQGVTTGLMSSSNRLDAFRPILLDNPMHPN